jgi:glycosyltransferase involved in cell wall biosynthesis
MGFAQSCISRRDQVNNKISIVTPSFNQGAFIEEALVSVKAQNYPDVEHIVIDGASTDQTLDILRRYSGTPGWEHLRWISEPDQGQTDALNKGFRMATGNIVGWLNSDDRYRPDCFAKIAQEFAKHGEADIIYGDYTWMDEKGQVKCVRREIEFSEFILAYHRVLYVASVSTFFRRRLFEEGNWLDTNFQFAMDFEFFLRLVSKGYQFHHIRSVLADFRWHSQNKSTTASQKQFADHTVIALMYSPVLRKMQGTPYQKPALAILRAVAAALRYWKKLFQGCYFGQIQPNHFFPSQSLLTTKRNT